MQAGIYTIVWRHVIKSDAPRTQCKIMIGDKHLSSGYSFVAEADNYDKEIGRKLSLKRAVKQSGIQKPERKEIWDAYRDSKKGGRW